MFHSGITCSTKSFPFSVAPILLTLLGVLCEFAMVTSVYVSLSMHEEEVLLLKNRCHT